jgi:hypothetical protein
MTELKPCPFCGGKVEIKDFTANIYGFNDYEIRCECGLRFRSISTCEHYWVGKTYHTPQTEKQKKIAYDKMIADYNRRVTP